MLEVSSESLSAGKEISVYCRRYFTRRPIRRGSRFNLESFLHHLKNGAFQIALAIVFLA